MQKQMEETKNNLRQEYNELKGDLIDISERLETKTKNKFETKLWNILTAGIFPFILSFGLVNTAILPELIPVVMFSSAIIAGTGMSYVMKSTKERKKDISLFKSIKNNKQIKEEEVNEKINLELTMNKMRVLEKLLNNISKKEELIDINENNICNLSEEDINKNINELKIKLLKAFDELETVSKRKVISQRFCQCRDKIQIFQDLFIIPLLISIFFIFSLNFPVYWAGGNVNLLNIISPILITEVVGASYVIKKTKTDKEIFKKLNKGLNKMALTKKFNSEAESKEVLDRIINENIEDVCLIYSELLEQKNLLGVKKQQNEESDKSLKTHNFSIDSKEPIMSIYGIYNNYFDTKEELNNFCLINNYPIKKQYRLDYMGDYLGRKDVVKIVEYTGKNNYYAMADSDGYACFNYHRSITEKEFVWEYEHGQIRELYNVFKNRGIVLANDIYYKLDQYHKSIYESIMNFEPVKKEKNKQKLLKNNY